MDYEEEGKSKIKLFAFLGIILVVVAIIVFVLIFNKESSKSEKIMECSASTSTGGVIFDRKVILNEVDSGFEMIFTTKIKSNSNNQANDSVFEFYKNQLSSNIESQLEEMKGYYHYSIKKRDNGIVFNIKLKIDKSSEPIFYKYLGFNVFDSSIDDVKNYFNKGGLK